MKTLSDAIFVTYFSNYSAHMVEYNQVLYPTAEHAYHCQRYSDSIIQEEIRNATSPFRAWEISQKYKTQQLSNFPELKVKIMEKICRAKLEQHIDIRNALISSKDVKIVKHIVTGPKQMDFGMLAMMEKVVTKWA